MEMKTKTQRKLYHYYNILKRGGGRNIFSHNFLVLYAEVAKKTVVDI